MADTKISAIPNVANPTTDAVLPIVNDMGGTPANGTVVLARLGVEAATLAAMTALIPSDGDVVYCQGRTAAGDGFEGHFTFDASATAANENDGTMIADDANDGLWMRDYTGSVNVKWFGAVGDSDGAGSGTDHRTMFQAISDDLSTAGGGTMYIPMDSAGGEYLISDNITIEENVRLTMDTGVTIMGSRSTTNTAAFVVGMKPGAQISGGRIAVDNNTFNGSLLRFDGGVSPTFNREEGTKVSDLMLEGKPDATHVDVGECRGIHMWCGGDGEAVQWVQFNNINISTCGFGIRMETANGTVAAGGTFVNGNTFNNIQFDNCEYFISTISPDQYNRVDGNIFNNLQVQAVGDTLKGFTIQGTRNRFNNVVVWDWGVAKADRATTLVEFVAGKSVGNTITLNGSDIDGDEITGDTDLNTWEKFGTMVGGARLYTVSTLTSTLDATKYEGFMAYASDAVGASLTGSMCYSNGTVWIDVTTGAAVTT